MARDGLEVPLELDFNIGYEHVCWKAYRELIGGSSSHDALHLIEYLEARPFRGKEVEFDGSIYGWVTSDEICRLHDALSVLPIHGLVDPSTDAGSALKFHADLLDALAQLRSQGCDGIVVAC